MSDVLREGLGYPAGVSGFERALVVFAHPDDAEFMCGGTIASWIQKGTEVRYVCATDGSAGWNGPDRSREEITSIRTDELQRAAGVLGVKGIEWLGFPDGALFPDLELRRAITREVRRHRPSVVVSPDPSALWSRDRTYVNHPDHRAVGEAVLAVIACDAPTLPQFPELLDEGLEPFSIPELWHPLMRSEGEHYVDITETIELKIEALRQHESQLENMGEDDISGRVRDTAERVGKHAGYMYAEAFRTFRLED